MVIAKRAVNNSYVMRFVSVLIIIIKQGDIEKAKFYADECLKYFKNDQINICIMFF